MMLYREGAKTCSPRCRQRMSRRAKGGPIPYALRSKDRWIRWRRVSRAGGMTKMPTSLGGFGISVTDAGQWVSHAKASQSNAGDGVGFVLNGDGLACVDLDGVVEGGRLDPRAATLLNALDPFYVEVSPSGNGIHAWLHGSSPSGRSVYVQDDGLKVEWYTDKRFICMTGNRLEDAAWRSPVDSVSVA